MKITFEKLSRYGLGMRTLKTALTVLICMIIFHTINFIFGMKNSSAYYFTSFYACTATIICLQATVQGTIKMGINRLFGTALGGAVGLLLLLVQDGIADSVWLLLITIGIIITISACNLIKRKDASSIACVVFLVIVINNNQDGRFIYAIQRMIETGAGVMIAAAVNSLIKTPLNTDADIS